MNHNVLIIIYTTKEKEYKSEQSKTIGNMDYNRDRIYYSNTIEANNNKLFINKSRII